MNEEKTQLGKKREKKKCQKDGSGKEVKRWKNDRREEGGGGGGGRGGGGRGGRGRDKEAITIVTNEGKGDRKDK